MIVTCLLLAAQFALTHAASLLPVRASTDLRALPIGDSITYGAQSTDRNGYRNTLHGLLLKDGNNVDFVGNLSSGLMIDNQHEGHVGKVIDDISTLSSVGIHAGVNLVFLHAGTNDANQNKDIDHAADRLQNLIEKILTYNPTAAILVCQIIPSSTASVQKNIEIFNSHVPAVVDHFTAANKRVLLVKMNESITVADLYDNLHPKDEGYVKMAHTYFDAFKTAQAKGWITAPGAPTKRDNSEKGGE